jgi:hypothetical protein
MPAGGPSIDSNGSLGVHTEEWAGSTQCYKSVSIGLFRTRFLDLCSMQATQPSL